MQRYRLHRKEAFGKVIHFGGSLVDYFTVLDQLEIREIVFHGCLLRLPRGAPTVSRRRLRYTPESNANPARRSSSAVEGNRLSCGGESRTGAFQPSSRNGPLISRRS